MALQMLLEDGMRNLNLSAQRHGLHKQLMNADGTPPNNTDNYGLWTVGHMIMAQRHVNKKSGGPAQVDTYNHIVISCNIYIYT